jgi:exodeoxyribonuclease-3
MEGYWCYWHGGKGYSGVGLHVSKSLAPERPIFSHPTFDYENRVVTVDVGQADLAGRLPGRAPGLPGGHPPAITVASIYVPNGGKDFPAKMRFLQGLEEWVRGLQAAGRMAVLCGDFNVARTDRDVHPKERKPRAIGQLPEERALLERIIGCGLVDVGRALDPDNDGLFTWWAPWRNLRQRNIGWRLDYVLASEPLAALAAACPVQKDVGTSDHAPVVAAFR